MKTAEDWTLEQPGIWQHDVTGNLMGYIDTQATTFKELVELIQQDAIKEGMIRAAALDLSETRARNRQIIIAASEQPITL